MVDTTTRNVGFLQQEYILIPYAPDWSFPVQHALRHQSAAAEGLTGIEERAAFFRTPRRRIQYTVTAAAPGRVFEIESTLRRALESARAAVPLWGREQVIASVSGSSVTLESALSPFKVGSLAAVASPMGDARGPAEVTAVNGAAVTLDDTLGAQPGDILVPVLLGRIEPVPSEAISGSGRSFSIRFKSAPPLETVTAAFEFTEMDNEATWLSFLSNLYFMFYIDLSGSMNADVPNITDAANNLKDLLRDVVYGGDQGLADHFVRIQNWTNERWLSRLAATVSGEQAPRYVSLAFINEARPVYHALPRNPAAEPTSSFTADYNLFQSEYARRSYSRCKVYSIDPTDSYWIPEYEAFNEHLQEAVEGTGGYAALGTPLASQKVFYQTGIPSGTTAQTYLDDIFQMLGN